MKLMCYAVLFIAFLLYYQTQPIFTIIIVVLIFSSYFLLKSKKGGGSIIGNIFMSGRPETRSNHSSELIKALLIQQMLNKSNLADDILFSGELDSFSYNNREFEIEQQKQRILSLFED